MGRERLVNLTGQTFGSWKVLKHAGMYQKKAGALWLCQCVCGKKRKVKSLALRNGVTKSCGCQRDNLDKVTHGATKGAKQGGKRTPEYISWAKIKQRCYNPNCKEYPWYGAKGVGMYRPWRTSFAAFLADMGPKPAGHVVGRIDHTKNYQPGNCRWITRRENSIEANKGYRPVGWNKGAGGKPKSHGMSKTRTYYSWAKAKRTGLINGRWKNFKAFLKNMGIRPADTNLARIDPSKGWERGNCQWGTKKDRAHLSLK